MGDYRHGEASRTNIPEAGLATQDTAPVEPVRYRYDPHLDPQLVWAGKAEHTSFDVDTVSLHIHERVSTAAVLRAVRREDVQRTLFSDTPSSRSTRSSTFTSTRWTGQTGWCWATRCWS